MTPTASTSTVSTETRLRELLAQRILILDGAMGTMIQQYKLTEEDYRGGPKGRFIDFTGPGRELFVKGNNELLSLTQPHIISAIHEEYLAAGADLIESNTFGATTVAQDDYHMAHLAYEMNVASARLARAACDKYSTPDKPRFVAGALGPTPKTASISPDVNDPAARNVTSWSPPTWSKPAAWWKAAPTYCWWKPFSIRSIARQRCSPSIPSLKNRACACRS